MKFNGMNVPKHQPDINFLEACTSAKALNCKRDCNKCIFADFDEYTAWDKAGRPGEKTGEAVKK